MNWQRHWHTRTLPELGDYIQVWTHDDFLFEGMVSSVVCGHITLIPATPDKGIKRWRKGLLKEMA